MADLSENGVKPALLRNGEFPIGALLGIALLCVGMHFAISTWTLGLDLPNLSPQQFLALLIYNLLRGLELAGLPILVGKWLKRNGKEILPGEILWLALATIIVVQILLAVLIKLAPVAWVNWQMLSHGATIVIYAFFMFQSKMRITWRILFGSAIVWVLWKMIGPDSPFPLSRAEVNAVTDILKIGSLIIAVFSILSDLRHRNQFSWQHLAGVILYVTMIVCDFILKIRV